MYSGCIVQYSSQCRPAVRAVNTVDTNELFRQESVAAVQSITDVECLVTSILIYYAAGRRGPHIASHSVCPSVCLSVRPVIVAIGNVFSSTASVTDVLFGTH